MHSIYTHCRFSITNQSAKFIIPINIDDMKWLTWLFTIINIYFAIYFLLNALHILGSIKYSQSATVVFAVLFTVMAAGSAYIMISRSDYKLALLINAGPWVLSSLFLFFNMVTSDYK